MPLCARSIDRINRYVCDRERMSELQRDGFDECGAAGFRISVDFIVLFWKKLHLNQSTLWQQTAHVRSLFCFPGGFASASKLNSEGRWPRLPNRRFFDVLLPCPFFQLCIVSLEVAKVCIWRQDVWWILRRQDVISVCKEFHCLIPVFDWQILAQH